MLSQHPGLFPVVTVVPISHLPFRHASDLCHGGRDGLWSQLLFIPTLWQLNLETLSFSRFLSYKNKNYIMYFPEVLGTWRELWEA